MWLWKGGNIFLLLFLLVCIAIVSVSCIRFYRSRQVWPLSSPSSTRRPSLIFLTCTLCAAWSILHTFKQIFDEDMPCALYVFLAAGIIQGLCLVFEVRLYSLLFLFECTENLCNMNEHRKQKAALVMNMEAEKKDNVALVGGLQLQSPPHSRLHGAAAGVGGSGGVGAAYQTPATLGTRHFEVQPNGSPVTNHEHLRHSPVHMAPVGETNALSEEPAIQAGTMVVANPHLNAVSLSLQQAASKDNSAEATPLSHVNRRLPQVDSALSHSSTTSGAGAGAASPATLSVQLASRGMENPTSPSLGTSDWMMRRPTVSTNNQLPAAVSNPSLTAATSLSQARNGLGDSNNAAVTPLLPFSNSPDVNTQTQPPMAHPGELARPQSLIRQSSPSNVTNPSPTVVAVNSTVENNNRAKVHFIEVEPNGRGSNSSATVNLLVSPKSNTTALTIPDDESASTLKAVPVGSGDTASRLADGDPNVRRSYIQPNWFVNHRSLMKTRFLLKWVLGWNVLLYSVLVVLLLADSHETSHLYLSTNSWNNLECNTMHVPGLQFMWVLVGLHLIFLLFGLHRLYANFPMDGFYVKQELYLSAALGLLCIVIQLVIPNSIEAELHRSAISPVLFLTEGSVVGFDVKTSEWIYFVPSEAFAVDLFFAILLPTIICEIITEGTLWKVEPSNDTTDLLSTEVVSNLDELLQTKHGFASFFNFLKTEFNMQNLLYWRACSNFQSAIDDHRYLLFNTTESMTGEVGLAGGPQTGITSSSGDDQIGGGSSGDQHVMSELGSSGGLHTMNAPGARHSPHNSVLSLSVNNVGLKVHRAPAAIMAQHPLFVATSQISQKSNINQLPQCPPQQGPTIGGHAGARYLSAPQGVLENVHHLHHPPRNANLPPGAISPSLTSMNSKAPFGAFNPYMVNNASLLNRMSGHGPGVLSHTGANPYRATEASALSLGGAFLHVPQDQPNAGGTSLIAPLAAPGRSVFGNAHQAVVMDNHPAPTPEIAAAEQANPALRVARLQREAAAIAVEHSRLHAIKLLEKAKSIHDRFVRDGAPYEVSDIPPALRANILEFMSLLQFEIKSPVDQVSDIGAIFVDSQDAIYALLQTDAFPRYLRSPFFQKFKSNNRARAALQQVRIQKLAKERAKKARREEYAAALATANMLNTTGAQVTQGPRVGAGFSRIPPTGAPAAAPVINGATQRSVRPASLPAGGGNVLLGIGAILNNNRSAYIAAEAKEDHADPMSSAANALRSAASGVGPHSVAGRGDMEPYYVVTQQVAPHGANARRPRSNSMSDDEDMQLPDGLEASNDADGHFDPKGSVASRSHASPFASADSPLIRSSAHPTEHLFPGGPMLSPPASAPMSPDITAEASQPLPQLTVIAHLQRHTAIAPLPSSTNVPVLSPVAIHATSSEDTVASLASTTLNNSAATSPNAEDASKSPSLHAPSGTNTSPTRLNKTLSSADGNLTRHEPDSPAGSAQMSRRDDESMLLQQSASLSVSRTGSVEGYGVDKQLLAAHMRLKPLAHESPKISSTRDAMQASVIIHPPTQPIPSVVQ